MSTNNTTVVNATPKTAEIIALEARITELTAKLERKANTENGLRLTEKGGISFYGCGRFPVTLYVGGWEKVIAAVKSGNLEAFLLKHNDKLSRKPAKA
jgi:hypothetical protein